MPATQTTSAEKHQFMQLLTTTYDSETRIATLKATYWLLTISIAGAFVGGSFGSSSEVLAEFFTSTVGIVVGIVILNAIPAIALAAVRSPTLGIAVLALDGFLSGIVMSPLLYICRRQAPELIWISLGVTASIFVSITAYIFVTRRTFSAPKAIVLGLFVSLAAAVLLNSRVESGGFGVVIAVAISVFGVILLVSNTSRILRNPVEVGAVPGALMLFAGIFNVFVGVLRVLLWIISLGGRRR